MAVTISFYNSFIKDVGLSRMNLASDTFKVMLVNAYTYNPTHVQKSQITGELSTGNGYTSGGSALTGLSWDWDDINQFTKLEANNLTITAAGGSIGPFSGAVIYNDTITSPTADRLVCYIDFGLTQTITDTTDLVLAFDTNGIFSIT